MHDIQVEVRPAQKKDIDRILQLQQQARRSCIRFGYEDLGKMIEHDYCFIADTGPLLWGFVAAALQQPELAQLRGLSLINGWRTADGVSRLLAPLTEAMTRDQIQFLMHLNQEAWLLPAFIGQGFITHDSIINFERHASLRPLLPLHTLPKTRLRYIQPHEIGALTALDHRAFAWPWQLSSGELVQLLLTSSRLVVMEMDEVLVGYACTTVQGTRAHIIRLAVDPAHQGMGIGRHLLADALDFAAPAGADTISLNTQWQNTESQKLYLGFGFRMVGRRIPVLVKALATS
ncbi:MAG: GNAT family N-acetyltransferase [Chloroflexi bacterium]|nr:GNAT family N-acetyltransferase [Chloroflexota bacterium]